MVGCDATISFQCDLEWKKDQCFVDWMNSLFRNITGGLSQIAQETMIECNS